MNAPIPVNETERIEELKKYKILDSNSEKNFDDITYLASVICDVPVAMINFVDTNRVWVKSSQGLKIDEMERNSAFCSHALNNNDIFLVEDTTKNKIFFSNPLVINEPGIRFYAGVPLITSTGLALGTLCIIDFVPKQLNETQQAALRSLSRQVITLLEFGKTIGEKKNIEEELSQNYEQYRQIVENASDLIYSFDARGKILYFNPKAHHLLKYEAEELLDKNYLDFIKPEYRNKIVAEFRKQLNRKIPNIYFEIPVVTKDGEEIWLGQNVQLIMQNGRVVRFQAVSRDISDRIKAEKELEIQKTYFEQLFQSSPLAVAILDKNDNILRINSEFKNMFNYTEVETVGKPINDLIVPPGLGSEANFLTGKVINGEAISYDTIRCRKDGTLLNVSILGSPIKGDSGQVAIYGIYRDVTAQKKYEKEREELIRELQEALKNIKTLNGLLPICSSCKKIRDDKGYWNKVEQYISQHTDASFTHGICPDCAEKIYPGLLKKKSQ